MKALEIILAILGAVLIVRLLIPTDMGLLLAITIGVASVFILIIVFKILLKLFRAIVKAIDNID